MMECDGMVWNVYSRMLLLYRAFQTGHDVGRGFSNCKFNLKLGTWCQQASMFSDVKFDHLLGFMHRLWVHAQRFVKSSLRWTERHLETGTMYARAVSLHMRTNYSVLYKLVKLSKDGEHPLGDFQMPDIGEDAIFKLSMAWMFLMQLVLCEVPLRIRSLEETLDRSRVPCGSMAVSSPGVARCPTGKAGRCIRPILMAGVQEKQQQIRSQVLLGVQELQKPKANPDLRRKLSGVVLPS